MHLGSCLRHWSLNRTQTLAEVASWPKLKDPSDAEPYVQQNIKDGADYIKLMHESGRSMGASFALPSLSLQTALIDAAHAHVSSSVCPLACNTSGPKNTA